MDAMTLVAKLTLNTSEYDSNLTSSEKKMKGLSTGGIAFGNIISNVVTKASKALFDFGKSTVQVGMDFDSTMSQVKALGQLGDDKLMLLRDRAIELGASTKFTAAQVGEAFSFMALAGWDTEEMLAGIDGVLNLAAASGEDLGRTSDIVTDAITAMGLTANDAGHFVDVLAAASANSNTTVSQMGEAFKFLATTGGVMKYSIDDVATTLGLLANNGIKASQAGTSMRQILNTLINPTDKASKAMANLGISLFEPKTNARKPLAQVLKEFRDVFKDAGLQMEEGFDPEEMQERLNKLNEWYDAEYAEIQKMPSGQQKALRDLDKLYDEKFVEEMKPNEAFLAKLGDIGGLRGISSLFAIMNSTDDDFQQLTDSIANSKGDAEEMAKTMLDNLQGDITIMNSAMEGLKIIVSDSFKEDLRSFVQTLTEEIGNLNEAFQENGVLGMFTNLANWVIDGLVDSLSKPSDKNVSDFGEAIGTFIGATVAKLVTNLPDMVSGIITIGESLAGGLIEGLFKGLFGENSESQQLMDTLEKQLSGIEVDNVKAQGLLSYLEQLASSGEENVTQTEAWKTAVEELEAIMPGVKSQLEAEGATLSENVAKVKQMTDAYRRQAIQQAMVNTLQKQYELLAEQGVEREKEIIKANIAQSQQDAARSLLLENIGKYATYLQKEVMKGNIEDTEQNLDYYRLLSEGKIWNGEGYSDLSSLSFEELQSMLGQLIGASGNAGELNEGMLSMEELQAVASQYNQAANDLSTANSNIESINSAMASTKEAIATTEAAVQSVSQELNGAAQGIGPAGASVVSALNNAASRIGSFSPTPVYTHAKGLNTVPYDNYVARLHRGERVLTKTEARQYREGNANVDFGAVMGQITDAIKNGMSGATVQSFLNGKDITRAVSRELGNQMKARRFAK